MPLTISPDATWNDDRFAEAMCGETMPTVTELTIQYPGVSNLLFRVPSCFASNATALTSIIAYNLLVDDVTLLPSSLTNIQLTSSSLTHPSSGQTISHDWSYFFDHFPSLAVLRLLVCGLDGELPATLPSGLADLDLSSNSLTGTIPATLFSNSSITAVSDMTFAVNENQLTGGIPSTLLNSPGLANIANLKLRFVSNSLDGSLPSNLLLPLASTLRFFDIRANINSLTGSIPGDFLMTADTPSILESVILDLSSNPTLNGPFPIGIFTSTINRLSTLSLTFTDSGITGNIPDLWANCDLTYLSYLTLNFGRNSLSGSIPPNLLTPTPKPLFSYEVDLNANSLEGSLDDTFFTRVNMSTMFTIKFVVSSNGLSGPLPSKLIDSTNPASVLTVATLNFNGNDFTGSFPSSYFSMFALGPVSAPTTPSSATPTSTPSDVMFYLDIGGNQLNGTLTLPALSSQAASRPFKLLLTAGANDFAGWRFHDDSASYLDTFSLGNNPSFLGAIPSSIFSGTSVLRSFSAVYPGVSGTMPNLGSASPPTLYNIQLAGTNIDFCSGSRAPWSAVIACNLGSTNAYYCRNYYPNCLSSLPPPAVPVFVPSASTAPPTSSSAGTPAQPTACLITARPSPIFSCINGTWITEADIETPVLIIPTGATHVVINANVSSSMVVLRGLGTSISILGCADNLTEITVELSPDDLKTIGSQLNQTLLSYDGTATCRDLRSVGLATKVTGSSCRKVSSTKYSSSSQLSAVFSVNASSCKIWWIVVVSVVCAVVIIAVVTIIVIRLTCCKKKSFHEQAKEFQK